jgi:plastocyanin
MGRLLRLALLALWAASSAGAGAAEPAGEVRGRLLGEHVFPAVVYVGATSASAAAPAERATMKQMHLRFVPQVLPVLAGTTVDFVNVDEMNHNVFSPSPRPFDLGTFGSGARAHLFAEPGEHIILCNIHVEMVGWVLVLATPWFASTDKEGAFTLRAPAGQQRIVVWRPRLPEESHAVEVVAGAVAQVEWQLGEKAP